MVKVEMGAMGNVMEIGLSKKQKQFWNRLIDSSIGSDFSLLRDERGSKLFS